MSSWWRGCTAAGALWLPPAPPQIKSSVANDRSIKTKHHRTATCEPFAQRRHDTGGRVFIGAQHAFGEPVALADDEALIERQADGWNSDSCLPRMVYETLTRGDRLVRQTSVHGLRRHRLEGRTGHSLTQFPSVSGLAVTRGIRRDDQAGERW